MSKAELKFISTGESIKDSTQGQLFGKACFKVNKKAFVCFFQEDMVFKLSGELHETALTLNGAKLFDPSGKNRPMKQWVQVPYEHHKLWITFAQAAASEVMEVD